jgi:hypothetical protein
MADPANASMHPATAITRHRVLMTDVDLVQVNFTRLFAWIRTVPQQTATRVPDWLRQALVPRQTVPIG